MTLRAFLIAAALAVLTYLLFSTLIVLPGLWAAVLAVIVFVLALNL